MSLDYSQKFKSQAEPTGEFKRQVAKFRHQVTADPNGQFPAEKGRYHLYVANICPWANRTMIVRALKQLEEIISVSIVHYELDSRGWRFSTEEECPGTIPDFVNNASFIREIYLKADPNFEDRCTVPVLWDKKKNTIVSNESSEIIRMFNSAFNHLIPTSAQKLDLYPEPLQGEIDEINDWVYDLINNGVYKTGFAAVQEQYDINVVKVFEGLDRVEALLSDGRKYLVANQLTEADIRLFVTVVRFDPAYHGQFKCNLKTIRHDYPHILTWARRIYQLPGVSDTINMEHIKKGYYGIKEYNPKGIVAISNGPDLNFPEVEP